MARSARSEFDGYIYGHWDPNTHGGVFLRNDAYRRLQNELATLRRNPQLADPTKLLNLINEMRQAWDYERNQYSKTIENILNEFRAELDRLERENNQNYTQLKAGLKSLQKQVERQRKRQEEIEKAINEIHNESNKDIRLANLYRKQAVAQLQSIIDSPYWRKYNEDTLNELITRVNWQFNQEQHPAALQAAALEVLAKIPAGQKLVDQKRLNFAVELDKANTQIEHALGLIDHYEHELFFDSDSQNPQDQVDVDYWTWGEFARVTHFVREELCPRMKNSETTYGYLIDDLKKDCDELKKAMENLEEIVSFAITAGVSSKRRCDLGQTISDNLNQQFYYDTILQGFDDDDNRLGYVLYMQCKCNDMDMRFIFNPIPGSDRIQTICDYRFNKFIDPALEKDHIDKLIELLRSFGIQIDSMNNGDDMEQNNDEMIPASDEIHLPENLKVQTANYHNA